MKQISSLMSFRAAGALAASFLLLSAGLAQTIPSPVRWDTASAKAGSSSLALGYNWVDGNVATFQRNRQVEEGFFGGVDHYRAQQEMGSNTSMTLDAKLMWGLGDYDIVLRVDNSENGGYLELGYDSSRVFYDGGGGYAPLTGTWFQLYDQRLSVDRMTLWLEIGMAKEQWSGRFRYERRERDGMKDSTAWGGSSVGNIAPSFWNLDESRDIFLVDVAFDADVVQAGGGLRWENSEFDDSLNTRPNVTAGNYLTQHNVNDTDLFSTHGFVRTQLGEAVHLSGAVSRSTIDTNLAGNSRIWGSEYDPVLNNTYPGIGSRDHGFMDMTGEAEWDQTVLTGNIAYLPAEDWRVVGNLTYENQSQEAMADFADIARGVVAAEEGTRSDRDFDEVQGKVDVSFNGIDNWVFGGVLEVSNGSGDLSEDLLDLEDPEVPEIFRETAFDRSFTKYSLTARWYPMTDLNFAFGYYNKTQDNDYDTTQDSTPSGADRYPAFVTKQKYQTDAWYARATWRPVSGISLTGRYDLRDSTIETDEMGIDETQVSDLETHVIAGILSWNPMSSVVLQASINKVYDMVVSSAARAPHPSGHANGRFDNNYQTVTVLALVAVDEMTDIQVDFTRYNADNFRDVATITLPFGLDATDEDYGVTVSRKVTDDMIWSLRYARAEYDEPSSGGFRDYSADLVYGRLQLRF